MTGTNKDLQAANVNVKAVEKSKLDSYDKDLSTDVRQAPPTMDLDGTETFYTKRHRNVSQRFRIIALSRTRGDQEPSSKKVSSGYDKKIWLEAIKRKVQTLKQTRYWTEVSGEIRDKVLQSKVSLNQKRDHMRAKVEHKTRPVVCSK